MRCPLFLLECLFASWDIGKGAHRRIEMTRNVIKTENAPAPIGPYSQAVGFGEILFCSGQIPMDHVTGKIVEGDPEAEAQMVIRNLEAVLEAGGSDLEKILRLDVFLTDMGIFPEVNDLLSRVFPGDPPARVTVGVSVLPMGARIEMAAIAVKKRPH